MNALGRGRSCDVARGLPGLRVARASRQWVRRSVVMVVTAVVALTVQSALVMVTTAHSATPLNVFVGYMDTHTLPSSSKQPSPWPLTDPTSYIGSPCAKFPNSTTCWDASALRLDNPGSVDISGVHPVVTIGSRTYNLWGTNLTVKAHGTLILTETGGQNSENFDGSDFSPNDYNGGNSASCVNSGAIPNVQITIAGSSTEYLDSGQVLNGGGADSGHCLNGTFVSSRMDESHPWVQVGTGSATAPSAPRSLAAVAGNGSVNLTWAAPSTDGGSAVTGYNVFRGTSPGTESATPVATTVTTNNYTDTNRVNGTTYYYTVAAVNGVGASPPSNEAFATPQATQATVPSAPSGLTAVAGQGSVGLSWAAPTSDGGSPVTGYNIYRGSTSGGEGATPLATNVRGTSFTDAGEVTGSAYYYKVAAVNAVGISQPSSEASATPRATVPSAPSGLVASGGDGSVALSWTAPVSDGGSGITGYNVYRGSTAGGESATPIATNVALTSFTDTGRTNGVTYFYEVAAVNKVGASPKSNEASAKPQAPVPLMGGFTGVTPVRVLDTRIGLGAPTAKLGAGRTLTLTVPGLPAGTTAIALNVTATNPTAASYLTLYPDANTRPTTSNLNFVAGQSIPNMVLVKLGPNNTITFYNNTGTVNVIADLLGYYH